MAFVLTFVEAILALVLVRLVYRVLKKLGRLAYRVVKDAHSDYPVRKERWGAGRAMFFTITDVILTLLLVRLVYRIIMNLVGLVRYGRKGPDDRDGGRSSALPQAHSAAD